MKVLAGSSLALLAFLSCTAAYAAEAACPLNGTDEHKVTIQQYTVRTMREDYKGCLEVRKDGDVIYRRDDGDILAYYIGNKVDGNSAGPEIKPGTDITGSGQPQVIIGSWSGGAHCCYAFRILQFGKEFKVVARLDAGDSDGAHFEDIDHDGKYEFLSNEWTFAYWRTSFAESPAPEVILRPVTSQNGYVEYKLALDLMRKPAPSQVQLDDMIVKIKSDESWKQHVPPALWTAMLDLIYTGHAELAWQVFDRSWPDKKPGKSGFLGAFCERLSDSHYDLADTLKGQPPDCSLDNFGPD